MTTSCGRISWAIMNDTLRQSHTINNKSPTSPRPEQFENPPASTEHIGIYLSNIIAYYIIVICVLFGNQFSIWRIATNKRLITNNIFNTRLFVFVSVNLINGIRFIALRYGWIIFCDQTVFTMNTNNILTCLDGTWDILTNVAEQVQK